MSSIVITAMGMASNLGPSTCACAAARAALNRPTDGPYRIAVTEEDARDQVTVLACKGVEGDTVADRIPKLLAKAVDDLSVSGAVPKCFLNISIAPSDALRAALPSDWRDPVIEQRGHAGVLCMLREAIEILDAGKVDRCVVGGVDSHIALATLERLDADRVLKTPVNGDGFIPGEGAALLLIERREDAEARGDAIVAEIGPCAEDKASYSLMAEEFVPTGAAWSRAINDALERNPGGAARVGNIVHDYNGWSRRGRELATAFMRSRMAHEALSNAQRSTPAESFGDVGAASAAFALCTSAAALSRGYAQGSEILVAAASEGGARAAGILRAAH